MNASTRKCTDAKPCQLMNCYACRRRLIDETATHMIELGMTKEAVDQYRYSSINNLAWEIETPKPKAPKATKPVTIDAEAVCAKTRTLGSHHEGTVELSRYKVPELRVIAKACGLGGVSRYLKADLVEMLVNHLIQYRLDTDAILNVKLS